MSLTANTPTHSDGEWETLFDEDMVPHVVPRIGPKHRFSMRCWCHPAVDHDYTVPAVSHNVAH